MQMYEPIEQFILPLSVFTKQYGTNLPQMIIVHESLYGVCDGLLDRQPLLVYFRKETPVVTMKLSRKSYTVPVNSSFKFSILYNPSNDLVKARRGYLFKTVADLMKAVPLPNVVIVGKECTSVKKKVGLRVVGEGQMLIIKGIESLSKRDRRLKCVTINDSEVIYLKERCEGQFSTRESLLLFPLSVLIKKQFQFPVATSLYSSDGRHLHAAFKDKSALIYNDHSTMSSLIASISTSDTATASRVNLIEICTTLSLDVEVINTDMTQLNQKTATLSRVLSPEHITVVIHDTSPTVNLLQHEFLLPINNRQWMHEVCLGEDAIYESVRVALLPPPIPPRKILKSTSLPPLLTRKSSLKPKHKVEKPDQKEKEMLYRQPSTSNALDLSVVYNNNKLSLSPPAVPCKLPKKVNSFNESDILMRGNQAYRITDFTRREEKHDTVSLQPTQTSIIQEETNPLSLLPGQTSVLPSEKVVFPNDPSTVVSTGAVLLSKGEFLDYNKHLLFNYNTEKIVTLLGQMGLKQYASTFKEESIDGKFLFQLDAEILKQELGMVKRLHRLKLMLIIRGTQCVNDYIN